MDVGESRIEKKRQVRSRSGGDLLEYSASHKRVRATGFFLHVFTCPSSVFYTTSSGTFAYGGMPSFRGTKPKSGETG